jgi:hypothetical protein
MIFHSFRPRADSCSAKVCCSEALSARRCIIKRIKCSKRAVIRLSLDQCSMLCERFSVDVLSRIIDTTGRAEAVRSPHIKICEDKKMAIRFRAHLASLTSRKIYENRLGKTVN